MPAVEQDHRLGASLCGERRDMTACTECQGADNPERGDRRNSNPDKQCSHHGLQLSIGRAERFFKANMRKSREKEACRDWNRKGTGKKFPGVVS